MKKYTAIIGTGIYSYEIKTKSLKEAKKKAKKLCIFKGEKVHSIY